MVAINETLSQKFTEIASHLGRGDINVEARTYYVSGGLDKENSGTSGISLTLTGDALEGSNMVPKEFVALMSRVATLNEHVQFESDHQHAENMAGKLHRFIEAGADIPHDFEAPFMEQSKPGAHPRPDHAFQINKHDTGVSLVVDMHNGKDPSVIANEMEQQKDSIRKILAERVAKYYTPETKDAAIEKINALDITISANKIGDRGRVEIELRSPEQLDKVKGAENRFNVTLDGEEATKLRESNPLNGLPDGDGSKENPALLQKAVARAFLFDGKKPRSYFAQIAGNIDMKNATAKALVNLKEQKPDMAGQIDNFLNDEIFKESHNHRHAFYLAGEQADGNDKQPPHIRKRTNNGGLSDTDKYIPGKVDIDFPLPAAHFDHIMEALPGDLDKLIAGLNTQKEQAAPTQEAASEKPPVQVGNTTIEPRKQAEITPGLVKNFLDEVKKGAEKVTGMSL